MRHAAVVLGASFGGIKAIRALISELSAPLPWPILAVQHITADAKVDYSTVFHVQGGIVACEASEKLTPEPGQLYVAPPGYHLLVERDGSLSLSVEEPVNWSRPSIDVLFESAADAYGAKLIGIVMTGASADGARGLAAIKAAGGFTVVQDPSTAEADTMPREALKLVAADQVLAPAAIGRFLAALARQESQGKEGESSDV